MISNIVNSSIIQVESNIDDLYKCMNIKPNKYTLIDKIKDDIPNFVSILRTFNLKKLAHSYPIVDDNVSSNIMDGDTDVTEVFNRIVKDKDHSIFESLAVTMQKDKKLVSEIITNFKKNRIDKNHLLDYFELLFGAGIHNSNKALIAALRKHYSSTNEPFANLKTHVREGRAYYFL
jgi:hypothetical protein